MKTHALIQSLKLRDRIQSRCQYVVGCYNGHFWSRGNKGVYVLREFDIYSSWADRNAHVHYNVVVIRFSISGNPEEETLVIPFDDFCGDLKSFVGDFAKCSIQRYEEVQMIKANKKLAMAQEEAEEFITKLKAAYPELDAWAKKLQEKGLQVLANSVANTNETIENLRQVFKSGGFVEPTEEETHKELCPECGKYNLIYPGGGGVKCPDPECGYWFCF